MSGQALLSVRGLTRDFRGFRAVDGVDLDVAPDSVHALVGPNGAGKTTLFNLLTGFLRPTAGRIELAGRDVTGLPPERVARLGVARSFQITSLFPQLSAREHVELALQSGSGLGWRFWRSAKLMRRYSERARRTARPGRPRRRWPRCPPTRWRTAASGPWNWPSRWRWSRRCCCSTSRPRAWGWRTSTAPSS